MDEKGAQGFGFFIGLLLTIMVSLALFWLFDFSTTVEYIIMGVCAVIFCFGGVIFAKLVLRRIPSKPLVAPPPPQPTSSPPQPTPSPPQPTSSPPQPTPLPPQPTQVQRPQ